MCSNFYWYFTWKNMEICQKFVEGGRVFSETKGFIIHKAISSSEWFLTHKKFTYLEINCVKFEEIKKKCQFAAKTNHKVILGFAFDCHNLSVKKRSSDVLLFRGPRSIHWTASLINKKHKATNLLLDILRSKKHQTSDKLPRNACASLRGFVNYFQFVIILLQCPSK